MVNKWTQYEKFEASEFYFLHVGLSAYISNEWLWEKEDRSDQQKIPMELNAFNLVKDY